ncbi:MAG: DUF3095 domain-containing protein [Cyanobacteriota bacterium]
MGTELFYANLPVLENFLDITDSENFQSVPRDWYVIITDIVNSTKAVESGRYKDVNLLGACSIIAVLNIAKKIEIPFVFGGDGATLLIPPCLFLEALQALLVTRQLAKRRFGMDLRVGAVCVSDVTAANYEVKVAKIKISEHYYQAAFTGDGLSYATQLIKKTETANFYNYNTFQRDAKADFSGLECRWQDIPSKYGETVSLIVKSISDQSDFNNIIYKELLEQILLLYGGEDYINPVAQENLNLAFSYKYLRAETQLRANSSKSWHKWLYFSQIFLENILGWLLMTYKIKLLGCNWGTYKQNAIATTDYRKFDDTLKMVIVGNKAQREKLTSYLEKNYKKGKLVYGLHTSDRALMTCLVFQRHGRQVHFIDGADGGYALAAKEMKQRIRIIQKNLDKCGRNNSVHQ